MPGGLQPKLGPALGASLVGSAAKLTWETRRVESWGLGLPHQLGHVTGPKRSWDINSGLLGFWLPREGKAFMLEL